MSLLTGNGQRRAKRAARDGVIVFESGPWRRVLSSSAMAAKYGDALVHAVNTYFVDSALGSAVEMRPPWTSVQASGSLGGVGSRYGQCLHEHVRDDGTIDRLVFIGGKMYSWNGTSTFTDISPGGAYALSTSARIFCVSFAGKVIVSDGAHQPWSYDPATTTAALIGYDTAGAGTAWTAFGQPVIFGAKLFMIVSTVGAASLRTTFVWSEENDPSLGYRQTGGATTYTNAWRFAQSDSHILFALASTNEALYVFREQSISAVRGLVNAAFVTSANVDAYPFGIGTTSGVLRYGDYLWFHDNTGRAYRMSIAGGEPEPLWRQYEDVRFEVSTDAVLSFVPDLRLVVMAPLASGQTHATEGRVFSADEGTYQGVWQLPLVTGGGETPCAFSALGVVRNASGTASLVALGSDMPDGNTPSTSEQGAVWRMKNLSEVTTDRADSTRTISARLYLHALPSGSKQEFTFDRVRFRVRPTFLDGAGTRTFNLSAYIASQSAEALHDQAAIVPDGQTSRGQGTTGEAWVEWGLGCTARWMQLVLTGPTSSQSAGTTPMSVLSAEILARPRGASAQGA